MHCELPQCITSVRMWAGGCNLGLPSLLFALPSSLSCPALPHQLWLVVVWLAVVSSADSLYAVALWQGFRSVSASAWGLPFPVPACCSRGRLAGAGSGSHCGVEFQLSTT